VENLKGVFIADYPSLVKQEVQNVRPILDGLTLHKYLMGIINKQ